MSSKLQFGSYVIPNVQSFDPKFADAVARSTRMPQTDGGFDIYGSSRAPSAVGKLTVTFTLIAETRDAMQALRDEVNELDNFGLQQFIWTPYGSIIPRFCMAKSNNIPMAQQPARHTDLWQTVRLIFQVPSPFWYVNEFEAPTWGGEDTWGGGAPWGGSPISQACSGLTTDFSVTNDGNAVSIPRFEIAPASGQSCTNPTIQRLVGGLPYDEISYNDTLTDTDVLRIDCRASSVLLNGVDAYDSKFSYDDPDWMRLQPGANSLRVKFDNPGDAATVKVYYFHTYK